MIEAFVKAMLFFVRGHERRRVVRARIRTWFYGRRLRQKTVKMDGDVYCGGPVRVYCDKVELGEHACFNGASLLGRGRIRIGHHFHSGAGLAILTENHDYEGAAIIQAGSVVHGEIPDYAIAGGNPAKVFAYRNKEHFEELAAAGAFH